MEARSARIPLHRSRRRETTPAWRKTSAATARAPSSCSAKPSPAPRAASSAGRCELRVEHPTRVLLAATRRKDCGRAAVNAPGHPEATRAPASSAGRRRPHSGRVLHPEFAATRKKVAWTSVQTPRRLWTEVQAALRRTAVFALPKRGGSPAGCRLRRAGSPRSPSPNRG